MSEQTQVQEAEPEITEVTPQADGELTQEPEVIPAEVTPEAPVEQPEKTYSYQPTDELGRPLGGLQVLKYRTDDELRGKLEQQNVLLIRRLRAETRKNRLGISEPEEIAEDAPRYQTPVAFAKRDLTPDERYKLSHDTGIPEEKLDEATDALFESALGVKPDVLRETLVRLQQNDQNMQAKAEAESFVRSNPDYVVCRENFETISNWMMRYKLAPVRDNFQKAFNTLKQAGVLVESTSVVQPVAEVVAEPATPAQATSIELPEAIPQPTPVVTQPVRIPTGLTRANATDTGSVRLPGDDIVYEFNVTDGKGNVTGKRTLKGMAAINAMPSDVYKHRVLHEPGFAKKEARLLQDRARSRGATASAE